MRWYCTFLRPCLRVHWVLHLVLSLRAWSKMWTHHMKPFKSQAQLHSLYITKWFVITHIANNYKSTIHMLSLTSCNICYVCLACLKCLNANISNQSEGPINCSMFRHCLPLHIAHTLDFPLLPFWLPYDARRNKVTAVISCYVCLNRYVVIKVPK